MGSRRNYWALVVAVTITGLGCGQGKTVVNGRVTYKSNPVTAGEVHFIGDGVSRSALIGSDGTFVIDNPPLGQVKVAVVAFENKQEATGPSLETGKAVGIRPPTTAIPLKYNDAKTSGLSYTISGGSQSIQISLTD